MDKPYLRVDEPYTWVRSRSYFQAKESRTSLITLNPKACSLPLRGWVVRLTEGSRWVRAAARDDKLVSCEQRAVGGFRMLTLFGLVLGTRVDSANFLGALRAARRWRICFNRMSILLTHRPYFAQIRIAEDRLCG